MYRPILHLEVGNSMEGPWKPVGVAISGRESVRRRVAPGEKMGLPSAASCSASDLLNAGTVQYRTLLGGTDRRQYCPARP